MMGAGQEGRSQGAEADDAHGPEEQLMRHPLDDG
jgi:hypothetical protein